MDGPEVLDLDVTTPSQGGVSAADRSAAGGQGAACPTCGGGTASEPMSHIYAIGRIEPRFPRLAIEKEFAQATGRAETAGLADRQALQKVLADPKNRYLVRQLLWVMTIAGQETYILMPRDPFDLGLLVDALRASPGAGDLDVVIGAKGPIAPPQLSNGLLVPIVIFEQIYSFDHASLIKAIPRPERVTAAQFNVASGELFDRIIQMTDNAGSTDDHRALNYLAVRYPAIYATAFDAFARNKSLSGVEVRPSPISGVRRIVEVIFSFTDRTTDVTERMFVRVDVTEEFPFLVKKIAPYLGL